jgi:multidrug transporter EmrE-like cation transporter
MGFSVLPIAFGATMAVLDLVMMSTVKQVHVGTWPLQTGLPFATLVYALQPYMFLQAMEYTGGGLAVVNLVWNLSSDVLVTLMGVLWFGEKIQGARWIAVCMSLVALALFAYTSKE